MTTIVWPDGKQSRLFLSSPSSVSVDDSRDRSARQGPGVRHGEARADGRDEEVAHVAHEEDEDHHEGVPGEVARRRAGAARSSRRTSVPRTIGWK